MATKPTTKQQAHGLITHFLKRYEKAYGTTPPAFNRYAVSFGFEGLALDYGVRAKEVIDFYFSNYNSHDVKWFIRNYGDVVEWMDEGAEDERERERLRKATIERMRRVRTNSSQSDQGGNPE